jgi:hypothetical protein
VLAFFTALSRYSLLWTLLRGPRMCEQVTHHITKLTTMYIFVRQNSVTRDTSTEHKVSPMFNHNTWWHEGRQAVQLLVTPTDRLYSFWLHWQTGSTATGYTDRHSKASGYTDRQVLQLLVTLTDRLYSFWLHWQAVQLLVTPTGRLYSFWLHR